MATTNTVSTSMRVTLWSTSEAKAKRLSRNIRRATDKEHVFSHCRSEAVRRRPLPLASYAVKTKQRDL